MAALCASIIYVYRIPLNQNYLGSTISVVAGTFCLSLAYPGFYSYLNNYEESIKLNNPVTRVMFTISLIVIVVRWFHQDSLEPLADARQFSISLPFITSNALYYGAITYSCTAISFAYYNAMRFSVGVTVFRVRCAIGWFFWTLDALATGYLMFISTLMLPITTEYVGAINKICAFGRLAIGIFVIVTMSTPSSWYMPIVSLINHINNKIQARDLQIIMKLKDTLHSIVPVPYQPVYDFVRAMQPNIDPNRERRLMLIRCINEIGDARRVILSHRQSGEICTADEEGNYYVSLLVNSKKIDRSGPYRPAVPTYLAKKNEQQDNIKTKNGIINISDQHLSSNMRNAIKYNKAVFKHMIQLKPDIKRKIKEEKENAHTYNDNPR
jgi:hypothetical protein